MLGIHVETDCQPRAGNSAGGRTTNFEYAAGVDAIFMARKIRLCASFNTGLPVILLGREDFFSMYLILFDERAKTMTVTEQSREDCYPWGR